MDVGILAFHLWSSAGNARLAIEVAVGASLPVEVCVGASTVRAVLAETCALAIYCALAGALFRFSVENRFLAWTTHEILAFSWHLALVLIIALFVVLAADFATALISGSAGTKAIRIFTNLNLARTTVWTSGCLARVGVFITDLVVSAAFFATVLISGSADTFAFVFIQVFSWTASLAITDLDPLALIINALFVESAASGATKRLSAPADACAAVRV